jgi:hypothetical protein
MPEMAVVSTGGERMPASPGCELSAAGANAAEVPAAGAHATEVPAAEVTTADVPTAKVPTARMSASVLSAVSARSKRYAAEGKDRSQGED